MYHAIAMTISGESPIGYAGLLVIIQYVKFSQRKFNEKFP